MSHGHSDNPHLGHHWNSMSQQFSAAKLGMWAFLAQEILFFSGLFCAYAVLRYNSPEAFKYGAEHLNKIWGGVNTVVLLISSLTMALAVRASQTGQKKQLLLMLALTFLGGCGFMAIKTVEYKAKGEHGTLWAGKFDYAYAFEHSGQDAKVLKGLESAIPTDSKRTEASHLLAAGEAPATTVVVEDVGHEESHAEGHTHEHDGHKTYGVPPADAGKFFSIYFCLTGLHGIHVVVGMGLIAWIFVNALNNKYGPQYFTQVDLVGLYWHLVDLIWIFLFPLLYLID